MMQVKVQSIDQIMEQRKKEFDEPIKDKSDDLFTIKENLNIEVIDHGDTYTDPVEVKDAVCCPECGEIVFLDSGSRKSEKHGDPESDVFSSEKITYDLVCSSCDCSFKATEHIKNIAWSIIFAIYVPIVVGFLSFLSTIIGEVVKQEKIKFVSLIIFACCALWLIVLHAIAFIFGNSNDDK